MRHCSSPLTKGFKSGDTDDSARFKLSYEDVEGSQADATLEVIFEGKMTIAPAHLRP